MNCQLTTLPNFKLIRGVGSYEGFNGGKVECCIMAAEVACWRLKNGIPLGEATARIECACPALRGLFIAWNDSSLWESDEHRTETLLPFLGRIAGTRDGLTQKRCYILADWAVRTIVVDTMEKVGLGEEASKLRSLKEVVDEETAITAKLAAEDVYKTNHLPNVANVAAKVANVAAYAAHAADVTDNVANVAAYAAVNAAVNAAAADCASQALGKDRSIEELKRIVERLISLP